MPIIKTERTLIRSIEKNDALKLFNYRSDVEINKYQGWIPKSVADAHAFIEKNPAQFNLVDTWFQLVVIEQETNEMIGDIGVHFIGQDNKQCEVGCTLNKQYQGRGFATESLRAVVDYLFKVLEKHRIVASIDPRNTASMKLVERIGFRKEGHFKESLFIGETWVDDVIYALLGREWK